MSDPSPLDRNDIEPVLLLGPGPASVSDRVLRAMARPLLGYMDRDFHTILEEECRGLRACFATANRVTFPLSGTGMSGMECLLANLLEPGDRLLVCVNGFFGERLCEVAARHGAEIHRLEAEWGSPIDPAALEREARRVAPAVVAVVHAETSTGCLQPLAPLVRAGKVGNALVIADCVTSIGGTAIDADAAGLDAAYAGSQKCLGAPPGLAPVTFGERAMSKIRARKTPVQSWYHDVTILERYYPFDPGSAPSAYHHTPSTSLHYALAEALRCLLETEGLTAAFARHQRNHRALVAGVEALGLRMLVKEGFRTPMLNAIHVPDGVDEAKIRARLRETHRIEIGAGLGKLRGKIIRIGLMGHSSRAGNVVRALAALADALQSQGYRCSPGAAVDAAGAELTRP
jgi:alanine-glyoxylate transaminase/serine-glyoxylate transaminase/serine-pyruvate transaminase